VPKAQGKTNAALSVLDVQHFGRKSAMSTFKEAIQSGLEEYLQALQRAIAGLTPPEVRWQPAPHTNHIAWLVWHMARVEDGWVSRLRRRLPVWQADGWADRFHMDPVSSGGGQTMEEVRAMPEISLTDLMAYFDAVRAVTRRYLEQATDTDERQRSASMERRRSV
jgi:hypothetical protein